MFKVNFSEIKKAGIKGVLLDLDNTLYAYKPCQRHALKSCYAYFREIQPMPFKQFKGGYESARKENKKYTAGQAASHSRFLNFQRFLEKKFGKTNIGLTIKLEELYWQSFMKRIKLFGGAIDFLKKCRENDIKVCLITDLTARIQFEKIRFLRIGKYLDYVVSSEEAGRDKPSPIIFKLALKKLKLRSKEVVLIGDDYDKDLAGGAKMGIKTILVNNHF